MEKTSQSRSWKLQDQCKQQLFPETKDFTFEVTMKPKLKCIAYSVFPKYVSYGKTSWSKNIFLFLWRIVQPASVNNSFLFK